MTEQNISSIICLQNELPIIKLSEYNLDSYVKGYHVYKDIWKPNIGDVRGGSRNISELGNYL